MGRSFVALMLGASLGSGLAHGAGSVQCCKSVSPQFPPATPYGATMYREDDPRSNYVPYKPMPLDASGSVKDMFDKLGSTELEDGPYSAELVPALQGLGAALFEEQRFRDAIDVYSRAIHLLRVNEGLQTFNQTGLVEQVIEAQVALGDFVSADAQQEYLFRIRRASLPANDPQMLASVEQFADWHRAAYLGELDRFRYPRIVQLLDLYTEMIDAVGEESGKFSRDVLPYLKGKLKTEYLLSIYPGETEVSIQAEREQKNEIDQPELTKLRFKKFSNENFRRGQKTIHYIRIIVENNKRSTPAEIADVRVALGDWYQWHRRYSQAIKEYATAWELMLEQPDYGSWVGDTFGDPVELPAQIVFHPGRMPLRLTHAEEVTARFEVTRHGEAKNIEILTPSKKENQPAVTRGYKYLRDMRFRPRLLDGEIVAVEAIERTYNIRY